MNDDFPRGWVLYDGTCGFCSWWVPFWKRTLYKAGLDVAALQADWVQKRVRLSPEELVNDVRILLKDNSLIRGADVYLYVMKRIWWAMPFGFFFSIPGIKWLFWRFYKIFNRNRYRVSKVCKLPPQYKN